MQRYQEKFNYKRTLLEQMGIAAMFHTHEASELEPYDVYVYVVVENRITKAKWAEVEAGFFPLVPDSFEGAAGHCFKQVIINDTNTGPINYFGTVEQPCNDLSVVVGMDPDYLPTVYTTQLPNPKAPLADWNIVEYTLGCNGDAFTWDGGAATTIADHSRGACVASTTGGTLWVMRDGTPCFARDEYGSIDLEVYVLEENE